MVGGSRTINAPDPQNGRAFSGWSDGGTRQHTIVVPAVTATYTATFAAAPVSTIYLSDLPTTGPAVNGWGPFERDRSNGETGAADGGPMRIDGVTYAKGLGVHALSDIRFAVPAGCTTFLAQVGIDDEVPGTQGSVTFEVWSGTTTRLSASPVMTGAMAAAPLSVPLESVRTLRLRVTPGSSDAYDHADWADAKLTCEGDATPSDLFDPPTSWSMGTNAHSVAIVDMNRDSRQDLLTANAGSDTVAIRMGNGDGTFGPAASYATGAEPKSAGAADLDGDGDLDVATANQGTGTITVLRNGGTGVLGARSDYSGPAGAHELALADFDGDGDQDIAAVGHGSSLMAVLENTGGGTFLPKRDYSVGSIPHSIVAADADGDSDLDAAVANLGSNSVSILLNDGTGRFTARTDVAVGSLPHSIRAGHLDGNAAVDLVVANQESNTVSVLLGNGRGGFAPHVEYATGTTPKAVLVADVDGDGRSDLLTANIRGNYPSLVTTGGDSVSVLLGNGDGTFGAKTDYTAGQGPFSLAAGRLDANARPDIATANWWDHDVTVRLSRP